ncbi:MAG TPA: VOC family protein, partial [Candidatus Methanoperedens sp.]
KLKNITMQGDSQIKGGIKMNKVSHFHIPVDNMDRAKKFYSSIFGWKTPADNIGFHAEFFDTEKNIIGLWEEKNR